MSIVCTIVVKQSKAYGIAYGITTLGIMYKIAVIIMLVTAAWGTVGLCYIPSTEKTIIIVTNSLEILCMVVEIILLWRIKAVNR